LSGCDYGGLDDRGLPEGSAPREGLEISPREAAALLGSDPEAVLLDVREAEELAAASIVGAVHVPMSDFARAFRELDVDEGTPIAVICHVGQRSLRVAVLLHREGLRGARSVFGGIDLWSRAVDPSVPRYSRGAE